ncbi:MAG: DUF2891 domain-containing protein [Xanthomonadales bacterium]
MIPKTLAILVLGLGLSHTAVGADEAVDTATASRFARLALDCIHREYPNKIAHVLNSAADAGTPAQLHPVFYGCFDWHSSVHGHWMLVRWLRLGVLPEALNAEIGAALERSFTPAGVAGEVAYFEAENRKSYERPYGSAWFLQLMTELREWDDPRAAAWRATLQPLEATVVRQLRTWLPNLLYPIRLGTHNQSMFAFGLVLDWARIAGDVELASLLEQKTRDFHLGDRACPLNYEPSGEDFLSPCLMEADLVRRVLPADAFPRWLGDFLPGIPVDGRGDWLEPGQVRDPTDGKLVHLDGVNLSRAWNLENIAAALPASDPRRASLQAAARVHAAAGIANVSAEHYEGSHWLASFATYLVTQRGKPAAP